MQSPTPAASAIRPPQRLLPAVASLMGAAGVVLGAVAAHRPGAAGLSVAASFLLFHAPAILALAALAPRSRPILLAQIGLALGTVLFSGAIAIELLSGVDLQPSPAPLGGSLMVFAWLLASAACARGRSAIHPGDEGAGK